MATLTNRLERLSLRLRIFLFFALIAFASCAILVVSLGFALQRIGFDALPHLILFGGIACFGIFFMTAWVWQKFDVNVAQPIERIVKNVRSLVHAGSPQQLDEETGRYLGLLNPAITEISAALTEERTQTEKRIAKAIQDAKKQTTHLESVIQSLDQGILICTLDFKILLYNRHAMQILHVAGDIGLGRSLFSVVSAAPFRHALERLTHRFEQGRHTRHREGLSQLVICATADGKHTLQGRMTLLLNEEDPTPFGFLVTFEDMTRQLAENIERDKLLHSALVDLRHPAANLLATAQMLDGDYKIDQDTRRSFERMLAEQASKLAERLEFYDQQSHEMLTSAWPMSDVYSSSLFNSILRRNSSETMKVTCEFVGESVWLHCDSITIVELLELALRRTAELTEVRAFQFKASEHAKKVYIDLCWRGDPLSIAQINNWLEEPLDQDLAGINSRDALSRHKTDFWSARSDEGCAYLRLPLARARDHHSLSVQDEQTFLLPERLEFYDFELMERKYLGSLEDAPLRELDYVVFDTETTGLDPSGGDEIISIAGVRIVNGRIIKGEVFDRFVHPGRSIPPASTKIHHITNEMVADADPIEIVLPRFHAFVSDAVLVAHNAAFDMKFLELKQRETGVHFKNPVLDTVLLAAQLQGQTSSLTLDALAEQFGIEIPPEVRHTALGDSLATAEVLLRLIDLLEASGITTLRQAVEAEKQAEAIRRQQARY
ncbi:exonuclease domain-containing protein [uncultured Cohaesibacter sp.]|uniref:3'-5' exonuclease n=1 Tax=uncultured Cohaesibacter sp. TaxID=1002546 RepID=UPI00292DBAC8|nr:exonuclease domain-containing protein [uncultured Cohaesibacter sp.]